MKLSLIIAVYNIENYIEACIKSIAVQDLTDCEVLLIDDGSTDRSSEICEKYANKHKNIKYFYKKNGGVGSARNVGLENAIGEYVWFIDGDDEISEDAVKELQKLMESTNSDAIMFYTLHKRLSEEKLRLENNMLFLKNLEASKFIDTTGIFSTAVWTFIFKRAFLYQKEFFFDENIHYEDNHFMYRLYNSSAKFSCLNKALYIYKAREGSLTKEWSSFSKDKTKSIFKLITLLNNMESVSLPDITIKNILFSHIKEYIRLILKFEADGLKKLFKEVPCQKIFIKDPKGIIFEKLLYNLNKKLYKKKISLNIEQEKNNLKKVKQVL